MMTFRGKELNREQRDDLLSKIVENPDHARDIIEQYIENLPGKEKEDNEQTLDEPEL